MIGSISHGTAQEEEKEEEEKDDDDDEVQLIDRNECGEGVGEKVCRYLFASAFYSCSQSTRHPRQDTKVSPSRENERKVDGKQTKK